MGSAYSLEAPINNAGPVSFANRRRSIEVIEGVGLVRRSATAIMGELRAERLLQQFVEDAFCDVERLSKICA